MQKSLSYRFFLLSIFILCFAVTLVSFYLQYAVGMNPCPLCIFQRVAVMITGIFAFILLFFPLQKLYSKIMAAIIVSIPAVFGLITAVRQIYIQSLPIDQVPACGPGLDFLIKNNSFSSMLTKVFKGSGECAIIEKFAYLPLTLWSITTFLIIILIATFGIILSKK